MSRYRESLETLFAAEHGVARERPEACLDEALHYTTVDAMVRRGWAVFAGAGRYKITAEGIHELNRLRKIWRRKPKLSPLSRIQKLEIQAMFHQGRTVADIASVFVCSKSLIYKVLKEPAEYDPDPELASIDGGDWRKFVMLFGSVESFRNETAWGDGPIGTGEAGKLGTRLFRLAGALGFNLT